MEKVIFDDFSLVTIEKFSLPSMMAKGNVCKRNVVE